METITQNAVICYYYIALFTTILFAIKTAMFIVLGTDGSEVIGDFNTEFDSDPSFSFVSLQSILAFLMGFGWSGYAAIKQFELSLFVSLVVALIVGTIFMLVTAWLMFCIMKLEKNVKKDKTTALDKTGKAYTNFAPNGNGQIEIEVSGQITIAQAINNTQDEIKSFETVKVVKVENEILYIEKIDS